MEFVHNNQRYNLLVEINAITRRYSKKIKKRKPKSFMSRQNINDYQMKTTKILMLAMISCMLFSCTQRLVDFTIISTKNIDLTKASTFQRGKTRVQGKDVAHMIIYVPIGTPNMKQAIDKALQSTSGAIALVDGVVFYKSWWAILYGQNIYIVEGTPLIDPSLASNSITIPDYSVIKLDKKGNVKQSSVISKDEYFALKSKIEKTKN